MGLKTWTIPLDLLLLALYSLSDWKCGPVGVNCVCLLYTIGLKTGNLVLLAVYYWIERLGITMLVIGTEKSGSGTNSRLGTHTGMGLIQRLKMLWKGRSSFSGAFFFRGEFQVWRGQRPEKVVKKCHFPLGGDGCQLRDGGSAETKTSRPLIISSVLGQASHRITSPPSGLTSPRIWLTSLPES